MRIIYIYNIYRIALLTHRASRVKQSCGASLRRVRTLHHQRQLYTVCVVGAKCARMSRRDARGRRRHIVTLDIALLKRCQGDIDFSTRTRQCEVDFSHSTTTPQYGSFCGSRVNRRSNIYNCSLRLIAMNMGICARMIPFYISFKIEQKTWKIIK